MTQILTQYIENTDLIMTHSQPLSKKIMTLWNLMDYFLAKIKTVNNLKHFVQKPTLNSSTMGENARDKLC